jgi:hypothetical protein
LLCPEMMLIPCQKGTCGRTPIERQDGLLPRYVVPNRSTSVSGYRLVESLVRREGSARCRFSLADYSNRRQQVPAGGPGFTSSICPSRERGCPILAAKPALVFWLRSKGGIRYTILFMLAFKTRISARLRIRALSRSFAALLSPCLRGRCSSPTSPDIFTSSHDH